MELRVGNMGKKELSYWIKPSHNDADWKEPQELSEPALHSEEVYSDPVAQGYVQFNHEHLQGRDPTASLGNLFQCLTNLMVDPKQFFTKNFQIFVCFE